MTTSASDALLVRLESELVKCREDRSTALNVAYAQIEDLRRQLAEAQELNELTQTYDGAALTASVKSLRKQVESARLQASNAEQQRVALTAENVELKAQLHEAQQNRDRQLKHLNAEGEQRSVLRSLSPNKGSLSSSCESGEQKWRARFEQLEASHKRLLAEQEKHLKESKRHQQDREKWRRYKIWANKTYPELVPVSSGKMPTVKKEESRDQQRRRSSPTKGLPAPPVKCESPFGPIAGPSRMPKAPLPVNPCVYRFDCTEERRTTPTQQIAADLGPPPTPMVEYSQLDVKSRKRKRLLCSDDESKAVIEQAEAKRRRKSDSDHTKTTSRTSAGGSKIYPLQQGRAAEELHPGQNYLDEIRRSRKAEVLADPSRYRIRKSAEQSKEEHGREKFEIDPERNGGLDFAFHDVVRNRAERKQMHGAECDCCRDYYMLVNNNDPQRARAHRQQRSRHRAQWQPPASPPGYWQMGFPSTAQVDDINRQAKDRRARKEEQIAADIEAGQGPYRRRG